jgi:pSer/pThr/pTyr-binding forkhead associated (FHA) protein
MNPKLIEAPPAGAGPDQSRDIPITKDEFLIGRGSDCDLRLRQSAISRHHCLIRTQGGELTLMDLGSSNGTYVNGQRVRSSMVLRSGDVIRLDVSHFVVNLGDTPEPAGPDTNAPTYKIKSPPVPKS